VLRVGILGAGFMGEVHARAWGRIGETRVVGIATLDPSRHAWLRGAGAALYEDPGDLIRSCEIDVVDICLPTPLHAPWVMKAAARGIHILCEKPFTLETAEAERAAEAVARAGVRFMPAHVVRFFPEYRKARDVALSGGIGQPRTARTFRGGAAPGWAAWILDPAQSGGVLVDLLVHDFDYLRWVLGPVRRIHARVVSRAPGSADHALTVLRFARGAVAHVEGSWAYPVGTPFMTRLELAGTEGLLVHDSRHILPVALSRRDEALESRYPLGALEPDPYTLMIQHFVDGLRGSAPFEVGMEDAVAAVRIAAAAVESARDGTPVDVAA
jgi:predicted dehydrogenase